MPFSDIDTLPAAPNRSTGSETFAEDADVFVAALKTFSEQLNVFIPELEAAAALIAAAPAYADPALAAMTGNTPAADRFIYLTGASSSALATLTAAARTLLAQATQGDMRTTGLGMSANGSSLVSAADYATMRALLDLEAGTDFLSPAALAAAYQPLDSDLTAIAALATTAFGRGLLTEADAASLRTTLGVLAGATSSGTASSGYMDIPTTGLGTIRVNWGRTSVGANSTSSPSLAASYTTALVGFGQAMTSATADSDSSYAHLSSTTQMTIANGTDGTLTFQWAAMGVV